MARAQLSDHVAHDVSSVDTLVCWRCDESSAAGSFVDAGPNARTLTQTGNPQPAPSLFNSGPTFGARTFNGSTQFGLRASTSDSPAFQWAWGTEGGITVSAWINIDASLSADGVIVEFGEFGELATQNVQLSFQVTSSSILRMFWEFGSGTNVVATATMATMTLATSHHVAAVIDDDPNAFDVRRVSFYVDGVLVSQVGGLTPPTGGSIARWCVGASPSNGTAAGSPGAFFKGIIDDVSVERFAATPQMILADYARGIRDFDESTLATLPFTEHHVGVWIEDKFGSIQDGVAGTWIDMTAQFGMNWVIGAEIDEDVDNQTQTATVELVGHYGEFNLSPFALQYTFGGAAFYSNPWNGSGGTSFATFLGPMRRVRIGVATVPWGTGPVGAEPFMRTYFDGYIKNVGVDADNGSIKLTCLDMGVVLQDVFIEPASGGFDRTYGSPAGSAVEGELQSIVNDNDPALYTVLAIDRGGTGGAVRVTLFIPATQVGLGRPHLLEVGDKFKITGTTNYNGTYTVASTTAGVVTTVETLTARALENVGLLTLLPLKSYIGGPVFIWTQTSPGFNVFDFSEPATQSVFTALEEVITQIGWKFGARFDDHRQCYRLAIFQASSIVTFGYIEPPRLLKANALDIESLRPRDIIIVEYLDDGDAASENDGSRPRRVVASTDPSQASVIGRRVGRVTAGVTNNINSRAAAQGLADTMLGDLAKPVAETSFDCMFEAWGDLGDFFFVRGEMGEGGFAAPDRLIMPRTMPASVSWGCKGIKRSIKDGSGRTTLMGRASSGATRVNRHFDLIQANGFVRGAGTLAPKTPSTPVLDALTKSIAARWTLPVNGLNRAWRWTQVHISTTTGFTPSSSTLAMIVPGNACTISQLPAGGRLTTGTTHFVKLIHVDDMGNLSAASAQTSAVPL